MSGRAHAARCILICTISKSAPGSCQPSVASLSCALRFMGCGILSGDWMSLSQVQGCGDVDQDKDKDPNMWQ